MNAVEIEEAISQLAPEPFDASEFPFAFLKAFGNKDTTIARLRSGASNSSDIPGGVLQRSNIHIATCKGGETARALTALKLSPKTTSAKARFILTTDGETFEAEDLTTGEPIACAYADFPNHFGFFLPLAGISTVKQVRDSAFDVRATGRLNKLYIELRKDNPEWDTADRQHDMNHFMARVIFCFFAEDTDIFFGNGLFTETVEKMSAPDSSNTHTKLVWETAKAFAAANDIAVELFDARDIEQLSNALAKISKSGSEFLVVLNDPFVFTYRKIIVDAVYRSRLPSIYGFREFVDDGGMISYGASITDTYRRAAGYVDKVLKGAKPTDLPAQLPTKFELVINLRTAKALGLDPPLQLLQRADELIE
jgi:hypothetical protein